MNINIVILTRTNLKKRKGQVLWPICTCAVKMWRPTWLTSDWLLVPKNVEPPNWTYIHCLMFLLINPPNCMQCVSHLPGIQRLALDNHLCSVSSTTWSTGWSTYICSIPTTPFGSLFVLYIRIMYAWFVLVGFKGYIGSGFRIQPPQIRILEKK